MLLSHRHLFSLSRQTSDHPSYRSPIEALLIAVVGCGIPTHGAFRGLYVA